VSEEIMAAEGAKPARTLEMVTAEIRYLDAQAGRLMMGHALEIGRRLTEAKELVPYGEWGSYIRDVLGYSQSTANKMMKLFDEYGAAQLGLFGPEVESESFTNLTYSKAVALLGVPREEREEFVQAVDAEHLSTRELQAAIRERDEARKALEEAEGKMHRLNEELEETLGNAEQAEIDREKAEARAVQIEKELENLKSRPIDVAVQEPDPAEVEKRAAELAAEAKEELERQAAAEVAEAKKQAAAAKDEADSERQVKEAMKASLEATEKKAAEDLKKAKEKAKAEREKLEARLKEAEEKLASAGAEEKAEAEKLRAEAETLRKQLAMSDAAITTAKVHFAAWQDAYRKLIEAANAAPDEARDKLRAAIRAQARAWGEETAE